MPQKILIVDDDTDLRSLLAHFLKQKGYAIVHAGDGMAAVDVSRREKPDLIILDIGLPAGDGFSVMQRLKQIPATTEIPIIAYSGADTDTNRSRSLECGANVFLKKPPKTEELLSEIEKLLAAGSYFSAMFRTPWSLYGRAMEPPKELSP